MTAIKIFVNAATMIPFEINIRENRGTGQRQIKRKQITKLNIITKTDPTRRRINALAKGKKFQHLIIHDLK
jgi:hypothetical protein